MGPRHLPLRSLACAVALAPFAAVIVLVHHYYGVSLWDYTPAWSDELVYWHQAATFRSHGFGGGYYTIDEAPAPVSFLHFGAHGPLFAALLGGLFAWVGWEPQYGPLFNGAVLAAATLAYFALVRPSWLKAVVTGAVLLTFWPLILYLTSTMQESLHQAFAIVLAGLFTRVVRERHELDVRLYTATVALVCVAALFRPTWALLLLPLFVLRQEAWSPRRVLAAVGVAVPVAGAFFVAMNVVAAPFPGFIASLTAAAGRSPAEAVRLLAEHFEQSAESAFAGHELMLALRVAIAGVIVVSAVALVRQRRRGGDLGLPLFHLLNLVPQVLLVLVLYDVGGWRDYRVFAPHLLLSVLVAVACVERVVVSAVLVANLAMVGLVGPVFYEFHRDHFTPVDRSTVVLGEKLRFDPDAGPWENTLLVDPVNFRPGLVHVPPGFGTSLYFEGVHGPVRSRYLLVSEHTAAGLEKNGCDLRLLAKTAHGNLYRRVDPQEAPASK